MIGMALEGGGAKGSYQVGAIIALLNNGVKPEMVAGSSIGAINAALIAQGDLEKMINLWTNTTTDIFGIDSTLIEKIKNNDFDFDDLKDTYENFKLILSNKGIDTDKILELINETIDEEKVRNSKIKFGLVTGMLKGFTPLELTIDEIPEGKLSEYLLASCYFPAFSYKKIIDDNYYLDGGFFNNLPISLLENYGCNKIYSIRIKGIGRYKKKFKNETEIIEIKPKKGLGSILIFDQESNLKHMKMGYYDALKVINDLDGNNFHFKKKRLSFYEKIIENVDQDILKKLKLRFRTKNDQELVIKVIEYLMKKNKYDEFKVYNIKSVIKKLKKENVVASGIYQEFIKSCRVFL